MVPSELERARVRRLLQNEVDERALGSLRTEISPLVLHLYAMQYNWDDGFGAPTAILANERCDLGTGLLLYFLAGGAEHLAHNPQHGRPDQQLFVSGLYDRVAHRRFATELIAYGHEWSRVALHKLKKLRPDVPAVFLQRSPGSDVDPGG